MNGGNNPLLVQVEGLTYPRFAFVILVRLEDEMVGGKLKGPS